MAKGSVPKGFAKTGKSKPAQFSPGVAGQRETGFKVKTLKQATAAMQGRPPQGGEVKAKPKNKGSKQFQNAPGKKVF
jgi:hypothetical protein